MRISMASIIAIIAIISMFSIPASAGSYTLTAGCTPQTPAQGLTPIYNIEYKVNAGAWTLSSGLANCALTATVAANTGDEITVQAQYDNSQLADKSGLVWSDPAIAAAPAPAVVPGKAVGVTVVIQPQ